MSADTSWFVPYIKTADKTELENMLIHATQRFSDEELNEIFATEYERSLENGKVKHD